MSNKIIKHQRIPLPFKVEVTLDGISGIKLNDAFRLTYVPCRL